MASNRNYMLNDKFPKQIKNATSTSDGLMSAEDKANFDKLFEFGLLSPATPFKDGLMSAADKTKLDDIEEGANNYIHPDNENIRHVSDEQIARWNKSAEQLSFDTISERDAYTATNTLEDGTIVIVKENNGSSYQYINDEFRKFRFDTDISNEIYDGLDSNSTTTSLSANQGKVLNEKIVNHTSNNTIHITDAERTAWNAKASTDLATQTSNGLMSKSDKTKLDGIESGANNYTHPDSHSASIIVQDTTHRFVTDEQISSWNSKAESIPVVTPDTDGLMSAEDKTILDQLVIKVNELEEKLQSAIFYG